MFVKVASHVTPTPFHEHHEKMAASCGIYMIGADRRFTVPTQRIRDFKLDLMISRDVVGLGITCAIGLDISLFTLRQPSSLAEGVQASSRDTSRIRDAKKKSKIKSCRLLWLPDAQSATYQL